MAKIALDLINPDSSLISLSLKPRIKWYPFIMAIASFSLALGSLFMIVTGIILEKSIQLWNQSGLTAGISIYQLDWWLIPVGVLGIYGGVFNITQATTHAWYTENLDKDVNTKGVVILKPISDIDLRLL